MTKTNEPLPYYKWLWRDWRADRRVQKLNYVSKGLYRSLLDEQWCEGGLPTSVEDLSDICGCPVEVMQENWTALSKFFEETEPGVLANSKLEKQRTDQDKIRAAKSRGGRASALQKLSKGQHVLTPVEDSLVSVAESHIAEQSRADTEQSISEQEVEDNFVGQENLMKLKTELTKIAAEHGAKAGGYKTTWDEIRTLGLSYGTGAVATDFAAFMEEYHGDDFPAGAVVSYLRIAPDRLTASTAPAMVVSNNPQITSLVRELTYLSDGKVTFQGRHKIQLAALLESFPPEELLSVFKTFIETKDLEDAYTLKYITQNYLDAADGLAYTTRRKKQESDDARVQRDLTAARLQEEAEAERREREAKRKAEEESFDPLSE